MDNNTPAAEPAKDYAPGATGVAGPGSQKMVGDEGGFIAALKKLISEYEGSAKDAEPVPAEPPAPAEPSKDAEPPAEPAKDAEPSAPAEPTKDAVPTKDAAPGMTATLDSASGNTAGIDSFMKDFLK